MQLAGRKARDQAALISGIMVPTISQAPSTFAVELVGVVFQALEKNCLGRHRRLLRMMLKIPAAPSARLRLRKDAQMAASAAAIHGISQ